MLSETPHVTACRNIRLSVNDGRECLVRQAMSRAVQRFPQGNEPQEKTLFRLLPAPRRKGRERRSYTPAPRKRNTLPRLGRGKGSRALLFHTMHDFTKLFRYVTFLFPCHAEKHGRKGALNDKPTGRVARRDGTSAGATQYGKHLRIHPCIEHGTE